jgi:threo-3-hydroxy-L-aspartate ammonia-lyase
VPRTIADGQAAVTPGELTFSVNRRLLSAVEVVSDEEIRAAMRLAFERLKIVIEPSGATGVAALLAGRIDPLPARVGVVVSGGNIGTLRFLELMRGDDDG